MCAAGLLFCAIAIGGCSSNRTFQPTRNFSPATDAYKVEPWHAVSKDGGRIETTSHQLYFTDASSPLVRFLPAYLESTSQHYANALGALPVSTSKHITYVVTTQFEYKKLATQHLGSDSAAFVGIRRGGFSAGGVAIYMDIGLHDTLMLASHEGWHQYTQTTFVDPLPIWLDEGIATYMEGFRLDGQRGRHRFLPWANVERFDRLRMIADANEVTPLPILLSQSPDYLLKQSESRALDYYAQVWAFVHFLHEGENSEHAPALSRMLQDAAAGRFESALKSRLRKREYEAALSTRRGPGPVQAYVSQDMRSLDRSYQSFVREITKIGARNSITMGMSPMSGQ